MLRDVTRNKIPTTSEDHVRSWRLGASTERRAVPGEIQACLFGERKAKAVAMKRNWMFVKRSAVDLRVLRPSWFDPGVLRTMARGIVTTRADEIGCHRCFTLVDQFVDLTLSGVLATQALPLVQDHLGRCPDCREEFEALLLAVRLIS